MNRLLDSFFRMRDHAVPIGARVASNSMAMADDAQRWRETPLRRQSSRLGVHSGYCSVTGNYRQLNEDRCFADEARHLLLIVDGMGGHRGGADASRIIVETIPNLLDSAVGDKAKPDDVCHAATEAIHVAREEILRFASTHPGYESMGATLTLAVATDDTVHIANVGDCRAYCLRGDRLSQLTTDQTFVQSMVDAGQLSKDDARSHPWRHVVLNAVGVRRMEEPIEVTSTQVQEGDRLLLATDGLTDVLDDEAIEKILAKRVEPQAVAEELVHRALENDSKDNVSCIVADFVARREPAAA